MSKTEVSTESLNFFPVRNFEMNSNLFQVSKIEDHDLKTNKSTDQNTLADEPTQNYISVPCEYWLLTFQS